MATELARHGVIYTTYFKLDEITDATGAIRIEKAPHYTDVVLQETDIVMVAKSERVNGKKVYLAECISSKRPDIIKSGDMIPSENNIPQLWKE